MNLGKDDNIIYGLEYGKSLPKYTLGQEILTSLLSTDETCMEDAITGRKMSYKTLLNEVCNLAEALRINGFESGTVISIISENNLEFFIPVLASILIGCIVAPVNQNYTSTELIHILNISKPKLIFCSSEVANKFTILKELKFVEKIIVIDSTSTVNLQNPEIQSLNKYVFDTLEGRNICPEKFQPFVGDPAKHGAFILCSSGTTGLPKGVIQSHLNVMTRIIQSRNPAYYRKEKTELILLPFFHGYGLNWCLVALLNKSKIIILKRFEEEIFLRCIQEHKIKALVLVPPLVVFLEKSPKVLTYDLTCVEDIFCGAAPLSKHTEIAVKKRLVNLNGIRQCYGLTETTLAVTLVPIGFERQGSSGTVVPYMACKIMNPKTGESLGPNQIGEVCIKGPLVMMGYFNNEKATRETLTSDNWLRTGDLGYYDDEKYFYIVDRLKELIKYKAFQVPPAELEAVLLKHPKVRDAGVVGLPNEISGELPMAFVVKHHGVGVTENELHTHLNSMVSPQKRLRGGIIFISEIPRTASGKILRRELREKIKKHRTLLENKL